MRTTLLGLSGLLLLEPDVYHDDRGFFLESYNQDVFNAAVGEPVQFVQDNQSRSRSGVLRGLHFQAEPNAQGKLVRVVRGAIFDVVVDVRRDSSTVGQWVGVELTAENGRQLWIPPGFAHGFLTLKDENDVLYKTTTFYHPASERTLRWDDRSVQIDWPISPIHISKKDRDGQSLDALLDRRTAASDEADALIGRG